MSIGVTVNVEVLMSVLLLHGRGLTKFIIADGHMCFDVKVTTDVMLSLDVMMPVLLQHDRDMNKLLNVDGLMCYELVVNMDVMMSELLLIIAATRPP